MRPLNIAYIGNFRPEHSTEQHVRQALERNGHSVFRLQENTREAWETLFTPDTWRALDFVLWTRTGWDWPASCGWSWEQAQEAQRRAVNACRERGVAVVGFHLDRWWGLDREGQIRDEAFFRSDLVVTADGGHDTQWAEAGVNHHWMPPAVLLAECEREPRHRPRYQHDIVFVGSWRLTRQSDGTWSGYHDEWAPHRKAMLDAVRARFGRLFVLYPRGRGLRGAELTDLYGNASVVIGDSCLSGGITSYWSDRVPETVGRRGFLIHPHVDGLERHFTDGEHLATYPLGDHGALCDLIGRYLDDREERERIRKAGQEHVMREHTYERRMADLVDLLVERRLVAA